jgi:hypothetical protein
VNAVASTVDDYVGKLPRTQAAMAEALRKAIKQGSKALTETVKWAHPVYEANGPICYFRAHRNHITFGLWRGVDLMAMSDRLESGGQRMAHLKIAGADDLDPALIKRLVAAAVKLNAEKGDPTKRG